MSEDSTRDIILNALEALTEKINDFEVKVDARFSALEAKQYDTRPIWEQALAEILEIKERLEGIEYKLDVLNKDVLQTRADQVRLDKRVTNLEGERT